VTVFLDPLALTFLDRDHSGEEEREITIGYTTRRKVVFVSHCNAGIAYESSRAEGDQKRAEAM
jgi:uncharacterized DUF497 family protein